MRLGGFLEKYTSFIPRERKLKNALTQALKEVASITIDPANIEVQEHHIFFNVSPLVKRSILFRKKEIREQVKTILPDLDCPDFL